METDRPAYRFPVEFDCPTCGQPAGKQCRSKNNNRLSSHVARRLVAHEVNRELWKDQWKKNMEAEKNGDDQS